MNGRAILTAATLVALAATPAAGQQHRHGQRADTTQAMMQGGMTGVMGGGMMGMMQSMQPRPGVLLAASDLLGLTAGQVERLTLLDEELAGERTGHMRAAMEAHRAASAALRGDDPDLEAYREALGEAADHMVIAHVAMARAAAAARAVLTPEQRERLEGALSMMRHLREGMMMGGGRTNGGMMGSGTPAGGHRERR